MEEQPEETYDKVCAYCHEANVGPVLDGPGAAARVRPRHRALGQPRDAAPAFRPTEIDDEILAGVAKLIATSTAK